MIKLRTATLNDIPAMQKMVVQEIADGVILKRDNDEVATNIRSYVLAYKNEVLIGYAALHIHSTLIGEIRSLIVSNKARGIGAGKQIVQYCMNDAKEIGLKEILVLTYISDFFKKLDFAEIEKDKIPEQKIWQDCIKCIHFPVCNEISLIYKV